MVGLIWINEGWVSLGSGVDERMSLGEKHSDLLLLDGMFALQTALRAQLFSVSPGPRGRKHLLGRTKYMKLLRI
jgi:hypothetical protein